MRHPRNLQAVLDWLEKNRSDDVPYFTGVLDAEKAGNSRAEAVLGLTLIGFEAGRVFQKEHPALPLGSGLHYVAEYPLPLRIGDRVRMVTSTPVERSDIPAGETGTVVVCDPDLVAIRLDRHWPILSEWDNELLWSPAEVQDADLDVPVPEYVASQVERLDEPSQLPEMVRGAVDFLESMADHQSDALGRACRAIRALLEG